MSMVDASDEDFLEYQVNYDFAKLVQQLPVGQAAYFLKYSDVYKPTLTHLEDTRSKVNGPPSDLTTLKVCFVHTHGPSKDSFPK